MGFEYIGSLIFGQLLPRTSIAGAVLVLAVLAALFLLYKWISNRIELSRAESEQRKALAQQKHDSEQAETAQLRAELAESRNYLLQQLQQSNRERNRNTRTLGSLCAEGRAQTSVLKDLKSAIGQHCDQCRDRHAALQVDMATLKAMRNTEG